MSRHGNVLLLIRSQSSLACVTADLATQRVLNVLTRGSQQRLDQLLLSFPNVDIQPYTDTVSIDRRVAPGDTDWVSVLNLLERRTILEASSESNNSLRSSFEFIGTCECQITDEYVVGS